MDAFEQSASPGEEFYFPEMFINGCTTEVNTGLVYDPRYIPSGLSTQLEQVQGDSGVLNIL